MQKKHLKSKGEEKMSKYVCSICGYVHEGDNAPEACPQCKAPASKFTAQAANDGAIKFACIVACCIIPFFSACGILLCDFVYGNAQSGEFLSFIAF